MKILYIHNNYANNNSGEEHAAEGIVNLLQQKGHTVEWFRRSSDVLQGSLKKTTAAFFTGLYNPKSVRQLKIKLKDFQPDIVQVQNLYPLISPAILQIIKKFGIPIVMRCPNYRLFCPSGLHLDPSGNVCEKCLTNGKEIHCVLKNCELNLFKSTGYALRNYFARRIWGIFKNVDMYIVQSEFQKQKFISNGIPAHKIAIVSGLTPAITSSITFEKEELVSFVGRVSVEKGIVEFIEAARLLPEIRFAVVGGVSQSLNYLKNESPQNIDWMGFLKGEQLDAFYQKSRIIVIPGKWYEGFPNVITRAMKHAKPVITSNLGAMASIIDHEQNGLLVEPGNAKDLAQAIQRLHKDPESCMLYGKNGKEKAEKYYSSVNIYNELFNIYSALYEK